MNLTCCVRQVEMRHSFDLRNQNELCSHHDQLKYICKKKTVLNKKKKEEAIQRIQ